MQESACWFPPVRGPKLAIGFLADNRAAMVRNGSTALQGSVSGIRLFPAGAADRPGVEIGGSRLLDGGDRALHARADEGARHPRRVVCPTQPAVRPGHDDAAVPLRTFLEEADRCDRRLARG